jgi:peptide subunit release factor 1 (eRF1)
MAEKNQKYAKEEAPKNNKKGFGSLIGKISGKDELESEIDRLNSEIEKLKLDITNAKSQLEKKEIFVKQATVDRQEAETRLNQELARTETLSRELDLLQNKFQDKLEFRFSETLSPSAFESYLFKLTSFRSPSEDLLTVYLPSGFELSKVLGEKTLERIGQDKVVLLDRLESETGKVFFYDYHRMISEIVIPPFPISKQAWHLQDSFETGFLEESLKSDYKLLILILHAGESFIGFTPDAKVFDEKELIRSSVKEKHSKGGFSQRRFERLREEDIAHHMNKVYEALDKFLEEIPPENPVDYIIMSGDLLLIKETQKRLPFKYEVLEKFLDIKLEKNNEEEILRNILSSRRYLL